MKATRVDESMNMHFHLLSLISHDICPMGAQNDFQFFYLCITLNKFIPLYDLCNMLAQRFKQFAYPPMTTEYKQRGDKMTHITDVILCEWQFSWSMFWQIMFQVISHSTASCQFWRRSEKLLWHFIFCKS